jgi:hypothetical protein
MLGRVRPLTEPPESLAGHGLEDGADVDVVIVDLGHDQLNAVAVSRAVHTSPLRPTIRRWRPFLPVVADRLGQRRMRLARRGAHLNPEERREHRPPGRSRRGAPGRRDPSRGALSCRQAIGSARRPFRWLS